MKRLPGLLVVALASAGAFPTVAHAGDAAASTEPATSEAAPPADGMVVFGRGESKVGTAAAASEGSLAGSDMLVRSLLTVGELLEAVPGMAAAQHSGSGKAN